MVLEKFALHEKVAIVTGAGRGIGKAIALALAEAGANVTVVSRTTEELEQTARMISNLGRGTLPITGDVRRRETAERVVNKTLSEFGKIDIMVNSAGEVTFRPVAFIPDMRVSDWNVPVPTNVDNKSCPVQDFEEWQSIMDTNLNSVFHFAQYVGPHMLERRRGKFVAVGSVNADEGVPGMSAYNVSKAALTTFIRTLASEWGSYNINVNAVAPGAVETGFSLPFLEDPDNKSFLLSLIPLGRFGTPDDVALLVLFLVSDAADYITGQVYVVDGGAMGKGPCI